MTAYNNGPFIGEAIDSLLAQTYGDFELIVVDDASTDDTPDIVNAYQDDRIVYFRREECTCSGNFARNDGLAISRGDLIALADADDIYVPDRLERQVRFLERHPDVDILGGSTVKIDADGRDIKQIITRPVYNRPHLYRLDLLRGRAVIANQTMVFRRRVLDRVPGFSDYPAGADYEFQLRASRYFNLHNLGQVLAYYRQHTGSVMHRTGHRLKKVLHRTFLAREYLWGQEKLEELRGFREPQL